MSSYAVAKFQGVICKSGSGYPGSLSMKYSGFIYNWRAERAPLSVELSEFSLYLYIYIYIFIYFRPYVVHVPLTRNAQTSDRPVEFQWPI